jgi:DNA repair protein RadC
MQESLFEETTKPEAIKHHRLNRVTIQMVKDGSVDYVAERFTAPAQTAAAYCAMVGLPDREIMAVLMLDGKNRITSIHRVSEGSLNQSIVHPREVFKAAILANSAAIILCHNHPTGDTTPSSEDISITRRLKESGEILGIKVLDHIIVNTETGEYLSFIERGLI